MIINRKSEQQPVLIYKMFLVRYHSSLYNRHQFHAFICQTHFMTERNFNDMKETIGYMKSISRSTIFVVLSDKQTSSKYCHHIERSSVFFLLYLSSTFTEKCLCKSSLVCSLANFCASSLQQNSFSPVATAGLPWESVVLRSILRSVLYNLHVRVYNFRNVVFQNMVRIFL